MSFEVSVVIPVYNREKYIERAIKSAIPFECVKEIIVVDDGSTDSSLEICQNLASIHNKIRVLTHPRHQNKGVSASRNLGITNAKSTYIAFLDSDDYYLPNRFDAEIRLCNDIGELDGVYGAATFNDTATNSKSLYTISTYIQPENLFKALLWQDKGLFCTPTITIRKQLFSTIGLFDPNLTVAEDTDLWFRLAAFAKIYPGNINDAVCNVEIHNSNTKNTKKYLYDESYKYIYSKLLRIILFSSKISFNNKNELLLSTNNYCRLFSKTYSESTFLLKIIIKKPLLLFCPAVYHKLFQIILR